MSRRIARKGSGAKNPGHFASQPAAGQLDVPHAAPAGGSGGAPTVVGERPRLAEMNRAAEFNAHAAGRYDRARNFDELRAFAEQDLLDAGFDAEYAELNATYAALDIDNTLPFEVRRDEDGYVYVRNTVAYGGPTTTVDVHPGGTITTRTYWGGEQAECTVTNPGLAAEMLEEYRGFFEEFQDPQQD